MKSMDSQQKKILDALRAAGTQAGGDGAKLAKAAADGDLTAALSSLRGEDAEKLRRLLGDREATARLLSSEQAQRLLRALRQEGRP